MKEVDGLMLQSSSNTTESPSPTLVAGGQALMEDTMKLQAVAEVDLDRINRERNDKLQSILNSNIEQRKKEFKEAEVTFERQKSRVDDLRAHLSEVTE